ncbi:MAG: T9SS type A sorting domain-containing protein [bacterium]|nr:T9SS type A sorting domain-containing protein [bacterium]
MKLSLIISAALLLVNVSLAGYIDQTGDWYISGYYEEPLIVGNRAYIADVYGMATLDVTNPANISLLSQQPGWGYSYGLDTLGNYAYVADWQNGITVLDISNPSAPQLVTKVPLPGEVWTVDVSGSILAAACGPAGVYFLSLANPANPTIVGNIGINGFAVDVVVSGNLAFVAGWEDGVFSIYIGNPASPQLRGSYTSNPGIVRGLDYEAGFIYVAEENYGLEILYSDDQGNMQFEGSVASTYDYYRLDAFGSNLYVCAGKDGLQIYNITLPPQPTLLYSVTAPTGEFSGVKYLNERLWIAAAQGGLYVYQYTGASAPSQIGHYSIAGQTLGVARANNIVYAAAKGDGLQVFQKNASSYQWLGGAASPDSARSVTLNGTIAYVPCGEAGVAVYQVSTPATPQLLTTINTPGFASRLYLDGNNALVADKAGGVSVLNISTPGAPTFVDTVRTMHQAMGLAKFGYILYVADRHAGLTIYNIANVSIPYLLGGMTFPDDAYDVALYGQYAFVAAASAGLRIVDSSDPQNVLEVAHVDLPGHAERVIVDDHWAFVALHDKGIAVVDITDPMNPDLNAYTETPGSAIDFALDGEQIILADTYSLGLYEFDPTAVEPEKPGSTPEGYNLEACYPNPFNGEVRINFSLSRPGLVSLTVYDLGGRQVAEILKGNFSSGPHLTTFNSSGMPSGVYLVRLTAGHHYATQKIVLLK